MPAAADAARDSSTGAAGLDTTHTSNRHSSGDGVGQPAADAHMPVALFSHDATVFLSFPQAIIGNYAVPILEEKQVWGTNDQTRTAYLDTTDVARMTLASLRCVIIGSFAH